jgi:dipeptidase E
MNLFLASRAIHPNTFKDIEEFIGGYEKRKILYIPTAYNGFLKYGTWKESSSYKKLSETQATITIGLLEETTEEELNDLIKSTEVIWFGGGMVGYLLYWIRRRNLHLNLRKFLKEGLLYVGSSAGAVIAGNDMSSAEWDSSDSEKGAGVIPGLSLVDFEVFPHYQDEHYSEIDENFRSGKMYLLKDGDAITVKDDKVNLIGDVEYIER